MDLWDEIVARGIPYDSHESDLYVPVTDETRALVRASGRSFTAFLSSTDHKMWYDIPFAYLPWWEKRTGKRNPSFRPNPGRKAAGIESGWTAKQLLGEVAAILARLEIGRTDDARAMADLIVGGTAYLEIARREFEEEFPELFRREGGSWPK